MHSDQTTAFNRITSFLSDFQKKNLLLECYVVRQHQILSEEALKWIRTIIAGFRHFVK
jgi:hypothetical protein